MKSTQLMRGAAGSLVFVVLAACFVEPENRESVEEVDDPEVEIEGGVGSQCSSSNPCDSGLTCCVTLPGQFPLKHCRDLQVDEDNCGVCGKHCASNERCVVGSCIPFPP